MGDWAPPGLSVWSPPLAPGVQAVPNFGRLVSPLTFCKAHGSFLTSVRLVAAGIVFGCGEEPKSPDKGQTTIAFSCTEHKICHKKSAAAFLNVTDDLDRALAKLARAHVNQNEADYARFMVALKDGSLLTASCQRLQRLIAKSTWQSLPSLVPKRQEALDYANSPAEFFVVAR